MDLKPSVIGEAKSGTEKSKNVLLLKIAKIYVDTACVKLMSQIWGI